MNLYVQRNWFLELHLDVLILWALAHASEFSKAEDLLKGLKSRLEGSSSFAFSLLDFALTKRKFSLVKSCKDEQQEATVDAERTIGWFNQTSFSPYLDLLFLFLVF